MIGFQLLKVHPLPRSLFDVKARLKTVPMVFLSIVLVNSSRHLRKILVPRTELLFQLPEKDVVSQRTVKRSPLGLASLVGLLKQQPTRNQFVLSFFDKLLEGVYDFLCFPFSGFLEDCFILATQKKKSENQKKKSSKNHISSRCVRNAFASSSIRRFQRVMVETSVPPGRAPPQSPSGGAPERERLQPDHLSRP